MLDDLLLPTATSSLTLGTVLVRLLLAALAGFLVAGISHLAIGRRKPEAGMLSATLVLLTVMLAMVTLVIGDSVARAFGLVGALSIVRFRTVVEDTRDTAFVIFAVIVGMAMGAGVFLVPLLGIPLVGAIGLLLASAGKGGLFAAVLTHRLRVRLGAGRDPEGTLTRVLEKYMQRHVLSALATARQGAALDVTYQGAIASAPDLVALAAELHQTDGVLEVEISSLG